MTLRLQLIKKKKTKAYIPEFSSILLINRRKTTHCDPTRRHVFVIAIVIQLYAIIMIVRVLSADYVTLENNYNKNYLFRDRSAGKFQYVGPYFYDV